MGNRSEAQFDELADVIVAQILVRIKSGEWKAADLKEARELLKDAGVQMTPKHKGISTLTEKLGQLPAFHDDPPPEHLLKAE